jgi:UDP-N-acetylmuramate--alanine ligase
VLAQGGLDPTVVIGGRLKSVGKNAVLGKGDFIVAEADESDGSFLSYSPTIAVVTNIDREHLDYYRDMDHIKDNFLRFIDRIPFYGLAVLCLDNEAVQDILPMIKKRFTTYGMSAQADYTAKRIEFDSLKTRFQIDYRGESLGEFQLNLPGLHNVYNATASIAVGRELGIPVPVIRQALDTVQGVQRRMEVKGEAKGVLVVDDYGHHPTEIRTTLDALKVCWPDRRKIVVFQPHRYTRTRALFDEFTRAFYQSDVLAVLPIYPAGEAAIEGVDARNLSEAIRLHGHKDVSYLESMDSGVSHLARIVREGDVVLTLGAGDVWKAGENMLQQLSETPDALAS